ncbi:hypothetical protein V493_03139 [Pseudogymnoascus sp. VKM F-4281 (FW-2241)]|nr:hypothetical protein V493_03139 [Pseudogymnoascus sp. VKM F-4281 (FW-2241)]
MADHGTPSHSGRSTVSHMFRNKQRRRPYHRPYRAVNEAAINARIRREVEEELRKEKVAAAAQKELLEKKEEFKLRFSEINKKGADNE